MFVARLPLAARPSVVGVRCSVREMTELIMKKCKLFVCLGLGKNMSKVGETCLPVNQSVLLFAHAL